MNTSTKKLILLVAIILISGAMNAQQETVFNFNDGESGIMPDGWTNASGKWTVKQDGENKVLAQTFKNSGMDFNVAIYDGIDLKDVEMSADIRAISGEEDQGGGLVWRYLNNDNYYIVRFNPLEDNYRFYKVEKGHRIQMASARASVEKGSWFSVKVEMKGNEVNCYLNDKKLLTKTDDTFFRPGKVGFWTKADAVSDFDNFTVKGR